MSHFPGVCIGGWDEILQRNRSLLDQSFQLPIQQTRQRHARHRSTSGTMAPDESDVATLDTEHGATHRNRTAMPLVPARYARIPVPAHQPLNQSALHSDSLRSCSFVMYSI